MQTLKLKNSFFSVSSFIPVFFFFLTKPFNTPTSDLCVCVPGEQVWGEVLEGKLAFTHTSGCLISVALQRPGGTPESPSKRMSRWAGHQLKMQL